MFIFMTLFLSPNSCCKKVFYLSLQNYKSKQIEGLKSARFYKTRGYIQERTRGCQINNTYLNTNQEPSLTSTRYL